MALSASESDDAARLLARKMFVDAAATANVPHDTIAAAIVAIDAFLDTNATAINNAFPVAFRTAASTPQKAYLVAWCCLKRAGAV